jgi:hypothetical protein
MYLPNHIALSHKSMRAAVSGSAPMQMDFYRQFTGLANFCQKYGDLHRALHGGRL